MMNVQSVNQEQLNAVSKEIQDTKGFGGATRTPHP